MTIKKIVTEEVLAGEQLAVPELYQQCLTNEEDWTKLDLEKLKILFFKFYIFKQRLFPWGPTRSDPLGISSRQRERYPRICMRLYQGNKYRDLLKLLRSARDRHSRLFVIAWWLAEEKICDPEEIVGFEELQQRGKKMFRCLSAGDFRHADTVRAWIPYFKRLLPDLRAAKDNSRLLSDGYDKTAIQTTYKKRSPTAAACDWLAENRPSLNVSSATLANAYSRVYGPKHYPSRRSGRP